MHEILRIFYSQALERSLDPLVTPNVVIFARATCSGEEGAAKFD